MSKQTFAERCQISEHLLPDAPYRAMLTKLHSEMLTALAEQPAQHTWVGLTDKEAQWLYDNCRTPSNLIDMTEVKLMEKNT